MSRSLSFAALSMAAVCATAASAQAPRHEPSVNDTLQSPEVSSDHHVTFRIFAPKASEVTLTGDWLGAMSTPKLSEDERGVWSVTLGPFEPSIYVPVEYFFLPIFRVIALCPGRSEKSSNVTPT